MINTFNSADIDRITPLQPTGWHDIRPFFRFYADQPFCSPVKIEIENQIVAIGCAILNENTGWLAHIIVSPQYRRQGLAHTITRGLIEIVETNGIETQMLIATKEGQPLYEQLGFRESCRYLLYKSERLPAPQPQDTIRPLTAADHGALLALDRRATGEDRGRMLNCCCTRGWVADTQDGGRMGGYFLPDLGEGAVVAGDGETGNKLLRLRLAVCENRAVLPAGNKAAVEFLAHQGLALDGSAARMIRNGEDPVNQSMIFNRVGGHFG